MRDGPTFGLPCPCCGITVEPREGNVCWVPQCPAFRLDPSSGEAKSRARMMPRVTLDTSAGRTDRTLAGTAALRRLDGQVALDFLRRQEVLERRAREDPLDSGEALAWLAAHKSVNAHGR